MPKHNITNPEQIEAFVQVWKYLSANGKLFIPVRDNPEFAEVYAEQDIEGNKVIRAFMDSQAIDLYIHQIMNTVQDPSFGNLKIGITPVKHLQTKLTEVYGRDQIDGKSVECLLTSYDEFGNIHDIDTIWTQTNN